MLKCKCGKFETNNLFEKCPVCGEIVKTIKEYLVGEFEARYALKKFWEYKHKTSEFFKVISQQTGDTFIKIKKDQIDKMNSNELVQEFASWNYKIMIKGA